MVKHQRFCSFGAIFFGLPLKSKLYALCAEKANLGPIGYTPCEDAFCVGASHLASLPDALTEQSARGSLVLAQTRSRLIM